MDLPLQSPDASQCDHLHTFDDDDEHAIQLRAGFSLLSPADLAALLAVDERTLAVWRCQKRGPDFCKLGRAVFYRKEDVSSWICLNVVATDRAP
jgi:Helix-turn-helix domain